MRKEILKINKSDIINVIRHFLEEEVWIGDMIIERYRNETVMVIRLNNGKEWLEQKIEVENA